MGTAIPPLHDEAGMVGRRIGAYQVARLIGTGGMGAVYEGTRADGDFDKRVAIKLLRPGMESEVALQRFRFERQVLASLHHRNIAALHDGGVTPDGQPYLVMEYVDGVPITAYFDARHATVRERISLFRQVCGAVQHAHQQLVVHRDLKPGNILVTADGTVKLLDFGIARLMREGEGTDQLPMTVGGPRLFTPEYASPEQVRGLPLTPSSDIYALGVILFELLTGQRPVATHGKLLSEIERDICTVPATRPSSLLAHGPGTLGDTPLRARQNVAGDLDAIVLVALAKEPARRFGSAEQLSTDLQRWLDGRPISARRASIAYRARKFVARNRYLVGAVTLAASALLGGIVSSARQVRRARTETAKFTEVNAFLSSMLSAADPGMQGRDVTVREVLDLSARNVASRALDPEVEAQVRHTIAQTYTGLGLSDSARVHAQRAWELRERLFGPNSAPALYSLSYVAASTEALGRYAEAESMARRAIAGWKMQDPPLPSEVANSLDMLARLVELQGRLDEARTIKLESLGIRRQLTDSASRADLPFTLHNLATSYAYAGQHAKAESLSREGVQVALDTRGPASLEYGELLKGLASEVSELGRHAEADSIAQRSIEVLRNVLGPEHPNYFRALFTRAQLRLSAGDARGALAALEPVIPAIGRFIPEGDQTGHSALQVQGLALDSLGRHEEAGPPLRRSLEMRRRVLPAGHWAIASSEAVLGYHLMYERKFAEAERLLTGAYPRLVASRGADAAVTTRVAQRLAELYGRLGRRADSAAWAAKLPGRPR